MEIPLVEAHLYILQNRGKHLHQPSQTPCPAVFHMAKASRPGSKVHPTCVANRSITEGSGSSSPSMLVRAMQRQCLDPSKLASHKSQQFRVLGNAATGRANPASSRMLKKLVIHCSQARASTRYRMVLRFVFQYSKPVLSLTLLSKASPEYDGKRSAGQGSTTSDT